MDKTLTRSILVEWQGKRYERHKAPHEYWVALVMSDDPDVVRGSDYRNAKYDLLSMLATSGYFDSFEPKALEDENERW